MYLLLPILTPGTVAPLPTLTASNGSFFFFGQIVLASPNKKRYYLKIFEKLVLVMEILDRDVGITFLNIFQIKLMFKVFRYSI
jgi:hypothetical protein